MASMKQIFLRSLISLLVFTLQGCYGAKQLKAKGSWTESKLPRRSISKLVVENGLSVTVQLAKGVSESKGGLPFSIVQIKGDANIEKHVKLTFEKEDLREDSTENEGETDEVTLRGSMYGQGKEHVLRLSTKQDTLIDYDSNDLKIIVVMPENSLNVLEVDNHSTVWIKSPKIFNSDYTSVSVKGRSEIVVDEIRARRFNLYARGHSKFTVTDDLELGKVDVDFTKITARDHSTVNMLKTGFGKGEVVASNSSHVFIEILDYVHQTTTSNALVHNSSHAKKSLILQWMAKSTISLMGQKVRGSKAKCRDLKTVSLLDFEKKQCPATGREGL